MANTIDWGKATQNNTNGFGKYQNTIGAASIYEDSYAGETALIGTSAAFSYAKSSYHQDETDPTPTITGTTGGTFSATPSGLSINSSTGTIDLSASTIQPYTITYTVDGVSANFSLSVTASPFIANTYSMNFDSASSQYISVPTTPNTADISVSFWVKYSTGYMVYIASGDGIFSYLRFAYQYGVVSVNWSGSYDLTTDIKDGNWHHVAVTFDNSTRELKGYTDGSLTATHTTAAVSNTNNIQTIGAWRAGTTGYFNGGIDEFAVFNTVLGEDAIEDIYNATYNNTGKALDLSTDYNNYTSSANLQYWNRLGD